MIVDNAKRDRRCLSRLLWYTIRGSNDVHGPETLKKEGFRTALFEVTQKLPNFSVSESNQRDFVSLPDDIAYLLGHPGCDTLLPKEVKSHEEHHENEDDG